MSPSRRSTVAVQPPPPQEEPPTVADPHAALPIVKNAADFRKLISSLSEPDQARALAWFNERLAVDKVELARAQQAFAARRKAAASAAAEHLPKTQIVTPGCRRIQNYVPGPPFKAPTHYIKTGIHREYISPRVLSNGDAVEYDLTKEDLDFLECHNVDIHSEDRALEECLIRMINTWEVATAFAPSVITLEQAVAATYACPALTTCSYNFISGTYNHWTKRRRDLGRPLLRRYWGVSMGANKSPAFNVFQTTLSSRSSVRRPKRTQQDQRQRISNLREDLLQIQGLIDKVIERDKLKLLIGELNLCIFDQMRRELVDQTYVSPYWQHLKKKRFREKLLESAEPLPLARAAGPPRAAVELCRGGDNLCANACKVVSLGVKWRPKMPLIRWRGSASEAKRCRQLQTSNGTALLAFQSEGGEELQAAQERSCAQQLLTLLDVTTDLGHRLRTNLTGGSSPGCPAVSAPSAGGSKVSRRFLET